MGVTVAVGGLISAGKSTFIGKLQETCQEKGWKYLVIPEQFTEAHRGMLPINNTAVDSCVLGQRAQAAALLPFLALSHDVVVMERNHLDHLAFHKALVETDRLSKDILPWGKAHVTELNLPDPDFYIYLDVFPEVAFNRKKSRESTNDDFFDLNFMERLKAAYEEVIPENAIRLDWANFGDELDLSHFVEAISQKNYEMVQLFASRSMTHDAKDRVL